MNDVAAPPIHLRHLEPLVVGNNVFTSFYDWTLTEKDLEKAHRELGETEEKKEECLRKLKKKLSNDANVKYRQDDGYLLRYLRTRKYDVSKAYQNMKLFYELRKRRPDYFVISPELKSVQELNWMTCLPYTDEERCVLLMINFKQWNPSEKTFEEMSQAQNSMIDVVLMNPKCQINGIKIIYDLSDASLKHMTELLCKERLWVSLTLTQNAFPMRIKKIIAFNTNQFVRYIYNILRPFMKRKISERVVLLGPDINDLHKHVNPALLPKRLGGSLEEEECDISQFILDNLRYIRYERSFKIA